MRQDAEWKRCCAGVDLVIVDEVSSDLPYVLGFVDVCFPEAAVVYLDNVRPY